MTDPLSSIFSLGQFSPPEFSQLTSGWHGLATIVHYPSLDFDNAIVHLLLILLLVVVNGYFVAVEVALIKLRAAQLDDTEEKYAENVEITRKVLGNLDRYIPTCKFGASITGVGLGAVSLPFLVNLYYPTIKSLGPESWRAGLLISFALAFCTILALLVVFGKVIPNSIGFRREREVSLICSQSIHYFFLVFFVPIVVLTKFSNWFMSAVLNIQPASEREPEHSAEDLKIFVEESGEDAVTETEKEILFNALELNDLTALDIFTPRSEVVALDINEPFEVNLERAVGSKHTRFPLINEHLDETLGQVHIKDLIYLLQRHRDSDKEPSLTDVRRPIAQITEDMALDELLKLFLSEKAHIALVVDKYGGAQGVVILNELLETLVGDIQDEFEEDEEELYQKISDDEYVIAGNMPLHELDDVIPELDLDSPDVSTVAGYVTSVIGHHPKEGETTEIEGFIVEVTKTDERKVHEVKLERIQKEDKTEVTEATRREESSNVPTERAEAL